MKTRTLTIVLCVLAALWPATGSSLRAEERLSVERLSFAGNRTYDDSRLRQLMLTTPSGFLQRSRFYPEVFTADVDNVIAFYQDNGFLDVTVTDTVVTVDSLRASVAILIALDEGPRTLVSDVTTTGNTVLPHTQILQAINLQPDDPYQRPVLQRGMLAILSQYGARGYIDAKVTPVLRIDSLAHRATIILQISEGYPVTVRDVQIEGLSHTKPSVVMRELSFASGDTIRPARLLESQKRLYRTNLFRSVYVRVRAGADSSAVERDVLIEVAEATTGAFSAALGYGSVEGVRGRVEIATRNLKGTARQGAVRLAASKINQSIEGSLTEPWTLGTRWRTDLSALYGFIDEPAFQARRWRISSVLGRDLAEHTSVAFTLRIEDATLRDVIVEDIPEDIGSRTRSLTASLRYDTRDNLFAPTQGAYAEWANEIAGALLGGTNRFVRTTVRLTGFLPLTRTTVLGSSLRMGAIGLLGITDSIPLNERFYAGGPTTLRGFDYEMVGPMSASGDPVGGLYEFVWNVAEFRQVVYKMIGVAAFLDLGNVWTQAADIRLDDVRTTAGIGLRAGTPIGIVRMDFGINLDPRDDEPPNRVHFSAGHTF